MVRHSLIPFSIAGGMVADSIFERIARGDEPAEIVLDEPRVMAIMDIAPMNPGHCLVFPKECAVGLSELPAADGAKMFLVAQRVAAALRMVLADCEGVNFFLADGQSAGQEVMHLHLHVIPRLEGDGIRFQRLPGSQRPRCLPGERSRIGALIAGHLDKESG